MTGKKLRQADSSGLRRRAEERIGKNAGTSLPNGTEEEPMRLLHELQQSEEKYRTVVEDLTEIIIRFKADGTITFVNDMYCRLFGKTKDELLGSTWHPNAFPDDVEMVDEQLRGLSLSNPVVVVENRVYTGTGEVRWMQFVNRGFFDLQERLVEIQAVGRDITNLKEAENALRTSDERLGMALSASKMGVWEWNLQTNALFWSPEVFEIFGVENTSGTLDAFTKVLHPDDADRLFASARQALAEKTTLTQEYRIIRSDGQVRWISDFARPSYDAQGNPLRLTGTVQDITERKEAEEEIKKLNANLSARSSELENANRELAAFNYMASHDLRRPLGNIFTSSQAIEMLCSDKLDEDSRELLQVIKNGAMNMSRLIRKLLALSNSEHAELRLKKIDLSTMARVVCAAMRLEEPERRVTFKICDGMIVNGDPELLSAVLENLFGNAWKYTANLEQATIEFGTMESDGKPTYFVRDNGSGFDMQEAEGIFLPYRRLPGSKGTGHGIGLATVEKIIRRHGGKIWALAEPGRGATFFFTLGE